MSFLKCLIFILLFTFSFISQGSPLLCTDALRNSFLLSQADLIRDHQIEIQMYKSMKPNGLQLEVEAQMAIRQTSSETFARAVDFKSISEHLDMIQELKYSARTKKLSSRLKIPLLGVFEQNVELAINSKDQVLSFVVLDGPLIGLTGTTTFSKIKNETVMITKAYTTKPLDKKLRLLPEFALKGLTQTILVKARQCLEE